MAETREAKPVESKVDLSKLKPKEVLALLGKLSPEQMSAVRGVAAEVGLPIAKSAGDSFARLPDGSVRVTVTIPNDLVPALESWAESAAEPLEDFLKHFATEAMTCYAMTDFQTLK